MILPGMIPATEKRGDQMTEWNRDLPAIEKRKAQEAAERIDAYAARILADHEQRMIEVNKTIAEAYAKRDAEIAAIRARRNLNN
jgi:hypothetical protein